MKPLSITEKKDKTHKPKTKKKKDWVLEYDMVPLSANMKRIMGEGSRRKEYFSSQKAAMQSLHDLIGNSPTWHKKIWEIRNWSITKRS